MRSFILLCAMIALPLSVSGRNDSSIVNRLLDGFDIKIPGPFKAKSATIKNIELKNLQLGDVDFDFTESKDKMSTLLALKLNQLGLYTSAEFHDVISGSADLTIITSGLIEVDFNLSTTAKSGITSSAPEKVVITKLAIDIGDYKCTDHIVFKGKCTDLVEKIIKSVESSEPIKESIAKALQPTITKLHLMSHYVEPESASVIAQKWEDDFSGLHSADIFNFTNSTGFNLVSTIINKVYGEVDDMSGKTGLTVLLDRFLPLSVNVSLPILNKYNQKVTLSKIDVKAANISSLVLKPVGTYTFQLTMDIPHAEVYVFADTEMNSFDKKFHYTEQSEISATTSLTLDMTFSAVVNKTQFASLHFGDLHLTKLVDILSDLECWIDHPIIAWDVTSMIVNLDTFDFKAEKLLSKDVERLVSETNTIVNTLYLKTVESLIANETSIKLVNMINEVLHIPKINQTTPNPCIGHDPKIKTKHSETWFNESKLVSIMDYTVNEFIGCQDAAGINSYIKVLGDMIPPINVTGSVTSDKYFGTIGWQLTNLKLSADTVSELDVMIPNATHATQVNQHFALDKLRVSIDVFFFVGGTHQKYFSDNMTIWVELDTFEVQSTIDASINNTRLLEPEIGSFSTDGCPVGTMDSLRFPWTEMFLKTFRMNIECKKNQCMSPLFYQIPGMMTSPNGVRQMTEGVVFILDQVNDILNNELVQNFLTAKTTGERDLCDTGVKPTPPGFGGKKSGTMTNWKAYLIVWGISGGYAAFLAIFTIVKFNKWKKLRIAEDGEDFVWRSSDYPLILHPSMSIYVRSGVFIGLLGTLAMFFSSNIPPVGVGAIVHAVVNLGGDNIQIENVFVYALANTIRDMWNGGVYPLSILVCVFSGIWPYSKMAGLIWAWVVPPCVIGHSRRESVLRVLDFFGKWSLIDSLMVVMMMVAFRLHITTPDYWEFVPNNIFVLDIVVTPFWGLFGFMTAAILSLTINHYMVLLHRNSVEYDETGGANNGWFAAVDPEFENEKEILATHSVYGEDKKKTRRRAMILVAALILSLVLLIWGTVEDTFKFQFEGLAAFALDVDNPDSQTNSYSLLALAHNVLNQIDINKGQPPAEFWYLVIGFVIFTFVMPILQVLGLLVLWFVPMTLTQQKIMFFVNEVISAWCALEVFVVVLIAALLEISKLAQFLIGGNCDAINYYMKTAIQPLGFLTQYKATCFDVKATLSRGCWLLFAACLVSNFVYIRAWKTAEEVIKARHHHQESLSPLNVQGKGTAFKSVGDAIEEEEEEEE